MKFDIIIFFLFFGTGSSAAAASSFLLMAMIGEVNRKKDNDSQIRYFFISWTRVWREYKLLYPNGKYSRALIVVFVTWGVFSLLSFVYLFDVLPKYALPSR
jgi:hypothetical protein